MAGKQTANDAPKMEALLQSVDHWNELYRGAQRILEQGGRHVSEDADPEYVVEALVWMRDLHQAVPLVRGLQGWAPLYQRLRELVVEQEWGRDSLRKELLAEIEALRGAPDTEGADKLDASDAVVANLVADIIHDNNAAREAQQAEALAAAVKAARKG